MNIDHARRVPEFPVNLNEKPESQDRSAVLRSVAKPDCCGLRFVSNKGLIRARSTCVKTFPGTESSVVRR